MLTAGFNLIQLHTYTLYMYTKNFTKSNDKNNIKLNNVFLVVSFSGGGSTSLTRKFLRTPRVTKSMTN